MSFFPFCLQSILWWLQSLVYQLMSLNPTTSMTLTVKSLCEASGGFWKVLQLSVRPNLRSASKKMPVPPLVWFRISNDDLVVWISYPPPTVTMVESPDMKSSLALRFLVLSSSSSSESGWTHWKCSMPDFVNLEEKLFRHVFCWYAALENLAQSTWIESTLQCQSTWSSSPCHPSDSAPPNLSSRKLQKSLEEILKIYFVQAA